MFEVSASKWRSIFSSITSAFEVFAPVMPSLKFVVIFELISRIRRLKKSSFCDRDDRDHAERQAPVDAEHYVNRADHVGDMPDEIHKAPGDERADAVRIAHDARVDIADRILAEIREGERLNVVEALALHIAADVQLDLAGVIGGDRIDDDLEEDHKEIEQNKRGQIRKGFVRYETVDRVFLEKRNNHVANAAENSEEHHRKENLLIFAQKRHEVAKPEKRKLHICVFSLFIHSAPPPLRFPSAARRFPDRCRPARSALRACPVRRSGRFRAR